MERWNTSHVLQAVVIRRNGQNLEVLSHRKGELSALLLRTAGKSWRLNPRRRRGFVDVSTIRPRRLVGRKSQCSPMLAFAIDQSAGSRSSWPCLALAPSKAQDPAQTRNAVSDLSSVAHIVTWALTLEATHLDGSRGPDARYSWRPE